MTSKDALRLPTASYNAAASSVRTPWRHELHTHYAGRGNLNHSMVWSQRWGRGAVCGGMTVRGDRAVRASNMMTMTSYGDDEDEDPQRRGPFRPPSLWPREAGRSAPGNNVYGARARTGTRTADLGQDSDSAAWGARGDRRRRCALPQAHEAVRRHGHAVSLSLSLSLSSLPPSLPPSLPRA